jgi:CHAT domain-containing protein/tetratricopeptide (TPR) repeat protein
MRHPRGRALVAVGLGVLAMAAGACRPAAAPPSGREALAVAVADTLPFQARLSGGFAPSKRGPMRAAGDGPPALSPDTRIAIALLEKRAIETPTPEALADLGVGYLVQGDIDRAITTIEDAASQMNAAAPWSDLSAAYLAKAERTPARKVEYLARALEAAEDSLKISRSNDALFNRALARDGLAPYTGAPAPWSEYALAEADSAWRAAALRHAADDRPIEDAGDRWEERRKDLPAKLQAGDLEFVKETVRRYPAAAIEYLDREVLVDPSALSQASLLASLIYDTTRDSMTRDEVAAARKGGPPLARAHQTYAKALARFEANDNAGARQLFNEAVRAFSKADAPYRAWAEARLAAIDWRESSFEASQRALARVEKEARSRGYTTLLARVLLQRGLAFNRQWKLTEALAAFREAAELYEQSAQRENAVSIYSNTADALRMLGEPTRSWEYIGRTLEELSTVRVPTRRYLLLYNAALFARRQSLGEASLLFQDAAVREAGNANTGVLTEAMIQRAYANIRRGDEARARDDLDRAAQQLASAPAGSYRSYMSAELEIVRAQLPGNQNASVANLQDAIAFFSRTEPGRVPNLFLLLARTPQAQASRDTAESALRSGIDRLEAQQAGLGDEALKISYFDESWALFQDMVALQVSAHNAPKAFEYAERSRARSLLAATQGSSESRTRLLPDIQALLPPSVVLLHYSTLTDRILIWAITSSNSTLVERSIAERDLTRAIEQHRVSIHNRRDNRDANDRLYALLIEPVATVLSPSAVVVLVPDGHLQQLPFATLRNPATRRYLVEDHTLMVSPSATYFVDARTAAMARMKTPIESALLVGNPAAVGARALPGAESEVAIASTLYRRHQLLVGRSATKDRFIEMAPNFDVVHFGGHAFVNPEFPLLSRLAFAGDAGTEQSLFAHEIARVRFPRTRVVVLAACSTATGVVSRGEGVISVARPFLGAGVPLVIASQWDVDDRATEQLTLVFHRELAKSSDPIQALRAAQLAMLRGGDAIQALPENWGAFVAVGTTAR